MNIQDRRKTLTVEELRRRYNLDALDKDRKAIKLQKEQLTKVDAELNDFVELTTKNLKELQDQVDGNITTWFFNGVPTVENEPSSNWTTDEEKINHLGDLYYDQDTGYAYRWAYENNDYTWSKIVDADVVEALAVANAAQDTADSKRRVFVNQPMTPYDIGDIWIKEDTDLYRCRASRGEGNFNPADWIRATNYTDDTVALGTKAELDQFKTQVTENYVTNAKLETTTNSITGRVEETYTYVTTVENEVNGLTETVDETINNVAQLEIKVDGITTEVSHKYDFLDSDEGTNQLDFDNSLEYKPVSFNIQGYTENFLYLFPMEAKLKELHIEGKSEQKTRSGKNKFNSDILTEKTVSGITLTKNTDGTITLNGTATADAIFDFSGFSITGTGNETMSLHRISGTGTDGRILVEFALYEDDNFTNMISATVSATGHQFTKTLADGVTYQFGDIYIKEGLTCNNFVVGIQIEDGEVTDFEQYGAMPSPDYPSEVKTVKGIRNLFNINGNHLIGSLNSNNGVITENTLSKFEIKENSITIKDTRAFQGYISDYYEIEQKDYILNFKSTNNNIFVGVAYFDNNKKYISHGKVYNSSSRELILAVPTNAKYIKYVLETGNITNTEITISDVMLEEGTTSHGYVPYGAWAKVKITGKNLFDKTSGIIENRYFASTGSITYTSTANNFLQETYIEAKPNTNYILFGDSYSKYLRICEYDKDRTFLKYNTSDTANELQITTQSNTKYIRISFCGTNALDVIQLEEGTATEYEAYKEKEVLIDLSKPNLFDKDNVINGYYLTNEGVEMVSTYWCVSDYIEVVENANYTYQGITSPGSAPYSCYYDKDKNFISSFHQTTGTNIITTPKNACYVRFSINTSVSDENKFVLFEGYTGYYELSSIGDTKDELSIIDGQVVIDKKIGKIVLDGSVAPSYIEEINGVYHYDIDNALKGGKCISNYFKYKYANENGFCYISSLWNRVGICITSIASSSDMSNWLSENNTTVYYELAIPQQITLPNTNIELFDGVNHITLVDDIETTITAVYNNNSNIETSLSGTNTVVITDCIERNLYPSDDLYPLGIIEGSCE